MQNIQKLRNEQKQGMNPGQHLGQFLLEHSNSPEYLVSQLQAYLEAAKADLESKRSILRKMLSHNHQFRTWGELTDGERWDIMHAENPPSFMVAQSNLWRVSSDGWQCKDRSQLQPQEI